MSSVSETGPARFRPGGGSLKKALTSDTAARWTSRLLLLVIWQLAGLASERFPTPLATFEVLIDEYNTPGKGLEWSPWDNMLVGNLLASLGRFALGLMFVIAIGIPLGWAMGRWWRVQAFFTDLVTVGIALPAFIWALLGIMWFGFGINAPVFVIIVSATPTMVIHVMQGSLAIPRELRDMSQVYRVSRWKTARDLVLPSMAGAVITGLRLSILAAWGLVMLVEWFGQNNGIGQRARLWYDSAVFDGLMAWGLVIIVVVIVFDRGVIERLDRWAHRWRGSLGGFTGTNETKGA
jgi:ABC-type nitrate/sulfonate/bicarbonate transport system permease component